MVERFPRRRLAILLSVSLLGVALVPIAAAKSGLLPGLVSAAPLAGAFFRAAAPAQSAAEAAGIAVVSEPAFTAAGAVVPVELAITGRPAGRLLYVEYGLEGAFPLDSVQHRAGPARPGPCLVQWPAPAPRHVTDVMLYRVLSGPGEELAGRPPDGGIPYGRWLNAGSPVPPPALAQIRWEPDRPYAAGSYGYIGASQAITVTRPVRRAASYGEEDLYAHQRVSINGQPFHYRFYYGTGVYQARLQVELHFLEPEMTGPGQRVFDILVDGEPLMTGLDLCAVAGPQTPYTLRREVTVTYCLGATPLLDIAFVPRLSEACVAGVAITTVSAIPQYTTSARVVRSADDAHVILDGPSLNRESFVRFGRYQDGFEYAAAFLCRELMVPKQAFISSAWLQVYSYEPAGWQYGPADVTVYAEAVDSAHDMSWHQPKATIRPLTAAGVRWVIDEPWAPGEAHDSVDIAAVVQELVDRLGWRPGNSPALLLMPNGGPIGWRDVVASDLADDEDSAGESKGAILHVTFVPALYRPDAR